MGTQALTDLKPHNLVEEAARDVDTSKVTQPLGGRPCT